MYQWLHCLYSIISSISMILHNLCYGLLSTTKLFLLLVICALMLYFKTKHHYNCPGVYLNNLSKYIQYIPCHVVKEEVSSMIYFLLTINALTLFDTSWWIILFLLWYRTWLSIVEIRQINLSLDSWCPFGKIFPGTFS